MQRKLTKEEIGKLKQARNGIFNGFIYSDTDEGGEYWREVTDKLDAKIHHGTSDGKPYVEPEPPIPEGWRKANADEYERKDVQFWHSTQQTWMSRPIQGDPFDPPECNTRYIVPIDPPLTDDDARERPWVMVRNSDAEKFRGPYRLGMVNQAGWKYTVFTKNDKRDSFFQARRATPEEIEAAHGNS